MENACVIFEGDWSGQIYLTCPMKYVHCSEDILLNLLVTLDDYDWHCNGGDGRGILFEVLPFGAGVPGGMGGGAIVDGLWIHERLEKASLLNRIAAVVFGESSVL